MVVTLLLLGLLGDVADAVPPSTEAIVPTPAVQVQAVRLGEVLVFDLRGARANKSAEQRARDASEALSRVAALDQEPNVRVAMQGEIATVMAADTPIVELSADDAERAGDSSLEIHAASVAAQVRDALEAEHRRANISKAVFSFSLMVFFGLIALFLIRRLGEFAERARKFLDQKPDRELALQVRKIEVMSPATVRSTGEMAVSLGKWLAQLAVVYAWLVVALSMFEATRDYTQRMTGFVLSPLSTLMERIASALPVMLVVLLAGLAVLVLVRYVDLFFKSVGRGETPLAWLAAELAAPASLLVRGAIVVAALVFGAPVVVGEGALSRTGELVLLTLAIASTPVLASGLAGVALLFGRRLRLGDFAQMGDTCGRIIAVTLLETRLRDDEQNEVRVPHLLALVRPMRLLGRKPRTTFELRVPAGAPHAELLARLEKIAARHSKEVTVELHTIEASFALYRVAGVCESNKARTALGIAVLETVAHAKAEEGVLA